QLDGEGQMTWLPMHSWHPVVVHLPLVGLLFSVVFDLAAVQRHSTRWRDAATALWWIGFLGAAAAITTGLIAYNRVEHSDLAHERGGRANGHAAESARPDTIR